MSNINIQVEDQTLYVTNAPKIAAQGIKENYVVFTFSADWDGFGKSALFYRLEDEDTVYESVVDASGKAVVPYEVTQKDGKICLGVCGVKNDVVKTSEIIKYKIVKGRYTSGEESQPPTPGIYEQMLTLAGSISDQVNNAPYVEYEEDGEYALPVHTINDNEETTSNTWSAKKIRAEIGNSFITDYFDTVINSIPAGGSAASVTGIDVTKQGYTPISIVGFSLSNNTVLTALELDSDTNNVGYVVYNPNSTAVTNVGVQVQILYVKNS